MNAALMTPFVSSFDVTYSVNMTQITTKTHFNLSIHNNYQMCCKYKAVITGRQLKYNMLNWP